MRSLLLSVTFLLSASFSFPGSNPQSQEPPKYPVGQFCSPKGDIIRGRATTTHPCKCKRHDEGDLTNPDADRMCKAGEPVNPTHDAVCNQWCNESACACPVECKTGHGSKPSGSHASGHEGSVKPAPTATPASTR